MKNKLIIIGILFLFNLSSHAKVIQIQQTAKEIVAKADKMARGKTSFAEVKITSV